MPQRRILLSAYVRGRRAQTVPQRTGGACRCPLLTAQPFEASRAAIRIPPQMLTRRIARKPSLSQAQDTAGLPLTN
jgi:hypothetical protein